MRRIETSFGRLRQLARPGSWGLFLALLLHVSCRDAPESEEPDSGHEKLLSSAVIVHPYEQVCAACHGEQGEGKTETKAPSIAGLPKWYIEEQFRKFREGQRGVHADDLPGQQMRAIALSLTEEQIDRASDAVASMDPVYTARPEDDVDLEHGRYLFANHCMECHRYTGKGEPVFHSAPLISLNREYLRRQLQNFHEGKRGAEEGDFYGAKMVNIASRLSNEEIEWLVDYIGALAHGDDPRPARER